jgi:hypothetical protein
MEKIERVKNIFMDCLYKDDEVINGVPVVEPIKVEGIINNIGFHPDRIEKHRNDIIKELKGFPDEFYDNTGGGWTFLNFCQTKDGVQWGEHINMEQLMLLGMAIGHVKYLMPKEIWKVLPGSMPYIVIKN